MDYYELSRTVKKLNRIFWAKIIIGIGCAVLGIILSSSISAILTRDTVFMFFCFLGCGFCGWSVDEGKKLKILEQKKREYEKRKEEEKRRNTIHL